MTRPTGWNPDGRRLSKDRVLSPDEFVDRVGMRKHRPPDDPSELASFRPYKVSAVGQLTLPAAVRRSWGIDGGGSVELAAFGDIVFVVPQGVTSEVLRSWLPADLDDESDSSDVPSVAKRLLRGAE